MHVKRLNLNDSEHIRSYLLKLCESHNIKIQFSQLHKYKYSFHNSVTRAIFIGERCLSQKLVNLVLLHEIQHNLLNHDALYDNRATIIKELESWKKCFELIEFDKEALNFAQCCINSYVFNTEITNLYQPNNGLRYTLKPLGNKPKKVRKMKNDLKEQRNLFNMAEMRLSLEYRARDGSSVRIFKPTSPKRLKRRK